MYAGSRLVCIAASVLLVLPGSLIAQEISAADDDARRALLDELRSYPHRIVFEAYEDANWELMIMNADGSGRSNLTNSTDIHELYPQASPDGSRICFLADVPRGTDTLRSVYVIAADGTNRKLIAEKARQPCWSPDSRKIAFVPQEFSRFRIADYASKGLLIHDLNTGKSEAVVNASIEHLYNLTWSADGQWIVSTVHGGMGYSHAIVAIEIAGDRVVDLKIPGCRPTLSQDGRRITWSSDDHTINVADISFDGPEPKVANIGIVDKRRHEHLYHPDFSPDARYVTYSIGPGGRMPANGPGTHTAVAEMVGVRGNWNINLRRIDGSGGVGPIVQLTTDGSQSNKESEWIAVPSGLAAVQ